MDSMPTSTGNSVIRIISVTVLGADQHVSEAIVLLVEKVSVATSEVIRIKDHETIGVRVEFVIATSLFVGPEYDLTSSFSPTNLGLSPALNSSKSSSQTSVSYST
jgi:hypothetical protein